MPRKPIQVKPQPIHESIGFLAAFFMVLFVVGGIILVYILFFSSGA
jgi:hypothetical protein